MPVISSTSSRESATGVFVNTITENRFNHHGFEPSHAAENIFKHIGLI